jgi:TetR/AcrR family transcriptional regulator, transcriptional repressor of bet genes
VPGARAPEPQRRAQIVDAALTVAARDRLDRLTVRRVAAEAGLSPGLVFHHLDDKETLLLAVLDRLIERTFIPVAGGSTLVAGAFTPGVGAAAEDDPSATASAAPITAGDLLLDRVRHDVARIADEREYIELFFDFWVMGTRHPEVRGRIAAALRAYRGALVPLATAVVAEEPERFAGTRPDRLAALVVAFVLGHAVQAVLDPEASDVEGVVVTLDALVPRSPPTAGPPAPRDRPLSR